MKRTLLIVLSVFNFLISSGQDFEWVKQISGNSVTYGYDFKVNASGFVYSVGTISDTTDVDPGPGVYNLYPNGGNSATYINKFDNAGNFYWAKKISELSWGRSLALDNIGNVYVTGNFGGASPVDFDPGLGTFLLSSLSSTIPDIFVLKLDSNGNFLWAKAINARASFSIVVDAAGNSYTGGNYTTTVDFDPNLGVFNLPCVVSDAFILKLDTNGNFVWVNQIGGAGAEKVLSLHIDSLQNVYAAGEFSDMVDFDPGIGTMMISPVGSADAFVLKIDTTGAITWVKNVGESGYDISTDNAGNVYLTGIFTGTSDMDPGVGTAILTSNGGGNDAFLLKLNYAGDFVYAKKVDGGGPLEPSGSRVFISPHGSCYWGCVFQGTVDLNPDLGVNEVSSLGSLDVFLVKFDAAGNYIWGKQMGGVGDDQIFELYADSLENVYVFGTFEDTASFDLGNTTAFLYSNGINDPFYVKYSNDSCSSLLLFIDSVVSNVSCLSSGFASGHALNGLPPYSYLWNTLPTTSSSSFLATIPGVYMLTVTDSNNCSKSTSIIINGPAVISGFDLNTNLISTNYRTGFSSTISLDAFNNGCIPTSGSLQLILDTLVIYTSAVPTPDLINGDTLIWNFNDLIYDSVHVMPQIIVQTPTWATIGDTVCFKTIISPSLGDIDTTNNIKQYFFPVINGYDPNDKKVYPQGLCAEGYVENNQLLTYTVRFQNTGNASAINIYVIDTLDMDLNLNTVRVIGNSHSVITEVLPGNVLKFRFDNINLADSTSNEAESHGYVIFEVLPNNGLSNGTAITNNVGIYFDFNPPIYTNTVLNTISDGTINTSVSSVGNVITASLPGVSYQWLNCDNGNSIIAGATNQSYTAVTSGNYAVIINDGCFIDTSACTLLTVIGISEVENNNQFSFYPNPSNNTITITTNESTQLKIINMLGEVVLEKKVQNNSIVDINNLSNGIYFIQTKEGYSTKLIKN